MSENNNFSESAKENEGNADDCDSNTSNMFREISFSKKDPISKDNFNNTEASTKVVSNMHIYFKLYNQYGLTKQSKLVENSSYIEKPQIFKNDARDVLNNETHIAIKNYPCQLPDILIKSFDVNKKNLRSEYRPDLLRNVSPCLSGGQNYVNSFHNKAETDCNRQLLQIKSSTEEIDLKPKNVDMNQHNFFNDDIGATPTNIIGDFEQEVEREFDLLVSGYSSRLKIPANGLHEIGLEQIVDANLSNACEKLSSNKLDATIVQLTPDAKTSAKLLVSHTPLQMIVFEEEDEKEIDSANNEKVASYSIEIPAPLQRPFVENTNFSTLNSGAYEKTKNLEISETEDRQETNLNIGLPLKSRYQKFSYDERQLPPIGIDYPRVNVSRTSFDKVNNYSNREYKSSERNATIQRSNKSSISIVRPCFQPRTKTFPSLSTSNQNVRNKKFKAFVAKQNNASERQKVEYNNNGANSNIINANKYQDIACWAKKLQASKKVKSKSSHDQALIYAESYDVEKSLPNIKIKGVDLHMKNTHDRIKRNDREEIRQKLAMGSKNDASRKQTVSKSQIPSNNYNEKTCQKDVSSDTESHSSDSETCPKLSKITQRYEHKSSDGFSLDYICSNYLMSEYFAQNKNKSILYGKESLPYKMSPTHDGRNDADRECDFFTKQARLQIETRLALAQAKNVARMQMKTDRHNQRLSPITGIIRNSLEKVGILMASEKRRVSRQMLTTMNITQLQIIVNDLHTQIEDLNDSLVHYLIERDDQHVVQDLMLVDIENLTRLLAIQETDKDDFK